MDAALVLEQVTKNYGNVRALNKLSLSIDPGIVYGILGPNGAGKTTCLRICTTLLSPDSGAVYIAGQKIQKGKKLPIELSIMPQGAALDGMLNVLDNLRYYCKLRRVPPSKANEQINELADLFGLNDFLHKSVLAISGGQFRRAQFARTFLGQPELVLLDEPTLGIDIQGKMTIWDSIRNYAKQKGCTIILASNDITEIEKTCDAVCFINKGELLYQGAVTNIHREALIKLQCLLAEKYIENTLLPPAEVSLVVEEDNIISLKFHKYSKDVFMFLEQLAQKYNIINIVEEKVGLLDLFDKYGGNR